MKTSNWTTEEESFLKSLMPQKLHIKQISAIMQRTKGACLGRMNKLGLKTGYRYKKHSHNEQFFNIPNELNSYWAGFTSADSCLKLKDKQKDGRTLAVYNLGLSMTDYHHLETLKRDCNYSGEIRKQIKRDKARKPGNEICYMATFEIGSAHAWFADLKRNFNIEPKKSLRDGPDINKLTKKQIFCYLTGLIDGDGCITHQFGQKKRQFCDHISIYFRSSSVKMIEWVKKVCEILVPFSFGLRVRKGILINRVTKSKLDNSYCYSLSGIRAILMFSFLKELNLPKLSRKWDQEGVVKLLEKEKEKYPELFERFRAHTDRLLQEVSGVLSDTSSGTKTNNYQIT